MFCKYIILKGFFLQVLIEKFASFAAPQPRNWIKNHDFEQ